MHPPAPANSVPGNTIDPSLIRIYRAWKGNNVFFLGGRFIFGPDVKSIFTTLFLVIAPVAVFCVFVARKFFDDFPNHSGYSILILVILLTIFVLIALILTSGRDPGIVPRNSYPPLPDNYDGSDSNNSEQNPPPHLPRSKEVIVNGIAVRVKYCDTCMLYRPPRCSHCSVCDNCVERFDHHCPWVGQCIGLRNYRFYYMFVFSATMLCLYVHAFCWVYIVRIKNSEEISIWKAMIKTPASIALIIYSFIAVWFVGGLTCFHTYLISTNQSTYENFRYRYDRQVNPYNKGVIENFKEVFCSSIPISKNSFRSKVPREPTESSRRRGVDTLMMPVYNEADEVEKDYKDEEYGKSSDLSDTSVDLGSMLHTERGQRQVASFLRQSLWEQSSRKWETASDVLDEVHEDGESKRITSDSSNEPDGNSTKTPL